MFMGTGLIMMSAGGVLLLIDLITIIVRAVTAPGKRKKLEEYLNDRY